MCVLVEGHCISDTVTLQEMITTPAAKLPYDHHHHHCKTPQSHNAMFNPLKLPQSYTHMFQCSFEYSHNSKVSNLSPVPLYSHLSCVLIQQFDRIRVVCQSRCLALSKQACRLQMAHRCSQSKNRPASRMSGERAPRVILYRRNKQMNQRSLISLRSRCTAMP